VSVEKIPLGCFQSNVKTGSLAQVPLVFIDGSPQMIPLAGKVPRKILAKLDIHR